MGYSVSVITPTREWAVSDNISHASMRRALEFIVAGSTADHQPARHTVAALLPGHNGVSLTRGQAGADARDLEDAVADADYARFPEGWVIEALRDACDQAARIPGASVYFG